MIFRSVGGPQDTIIACGEIDDSYGVIYASGETIESVLEGFTITGCGRLADSEGGGVRIDGHADSNCCQGVTIRKFSRGLLSLRPHVEHDEHEGTADNDQYCEAFHRVLTSYSPNPAERVALQRR